MPETSTPSFVHLCEDFRRRARRCALLRRLKLGPRRRHSIDAEVDRYTQHHSLWEISAGEAPLVPGVCEAPWGGVAQSGRWAWWAWWP